MAGGFRHYEQSLRVVDKLEYDGKGLNLTAEVRDGIGKHSKGKGPIIPTNKTELPITLEGQILRISDIIAYVNHDIDDALRAKMITEDDIPASSQKILGKTFAKRIDTIVIDVIEQSLKNKIEYISISAHIYEEVCKLRDFLYERVYWVKETGIEFRKIKNILHSIFHYILDNPTEYLPPYPEEDTLERRVMDFVAGMTDRYVMKLFKKITFPVQITGFLE
jgi:dGTPase